MIHRRKIKTKLKMKQKQITRPFIGKNAHFLWAFFLRFLQKFRYKLTKFIKNAAISLQNFDIYKTLTFHLNEINKEPLMYYS